MAKANALTAVFVKQCRTPGVYRDGNGLLLRVETGGARRWVLRITMRGKRRDIGLGSANTVPLAEARDRAAELRRKARDGIDPVAAQRTARTTIPTFAAAAAIVHRNRRTAWSNGKHQAQWINTLRDHAFPAMGHKPIGEIAAADVLEVLTPIWLTKPETARRVRQRIRVILEWAAVAGFCEGVNPADAVSAGLPRQPRRDGRFAAMPYAEVPAFLRAVRASRSAELVRLALEFLVLTAARTGEAIGARWSEMDIEDATWTVPAGRMKAQREHRVPLSEPCLAILERARELRPNAELVFPSRGGRPMSNMAMAMLLRRVGRTETVHGFRSAFRDWAAETTQLPARGLRGGSGARCGEPRRACLPAQRSFRATTRADGGLGTIRAGVRLNLRRHQTEPRRRQLRESRGQDQRQAPCAGSASGRSPRCSRAQRSSIRPD
jgi:integrase